MIETLLYFLVYLVVAALVFGLIRYVINALPFMDAPMKQVANVVLNVIAGIIVIVMLLALIGIVPGWRFGHFPH